MMTAYFIFKEDSESLANCYAMFNTTFSDLCEAFEEVTGEQLRIGDNAVKNSSTALKLNMSEDLKRYNEIILQSMEYNRVYLSIYSKLTHLGSKLIRPPLGLLTVTRNPLMKMFRISWPASTSQN